MIPPCVNSGGPESIIRLEGVPVLESASELSVRGMDALRRWKGRPGEVLTVLDPDGGAYRARIVEAGPDRGVVFPFRRLSESSESSLRLDVYQALPEKERFELILQKLTELGVGRIYPYVSRRSITLEEREKGQRKSHRWPDVVLRAARQCRRAMIPELFSVLSWGEVIRTSAVAGEKIMLYEGSAPSKLREALGQKPSARVALLVGPEGGFDPEEVEEACRNGFAPVTLGSRILRTETAAITAASILQYALGDLG